MFDSIFIIGLGLLTGFVFGFLLQKGRVTKYETIVNQFLLRDWTVVKTMLTAVVVGGIGVYVLYDLGQTTLLIKPALLVANVGGGLIFGVGMALLGLCPGTAVAALGEGNRRAAVGIVGMMVGAFLAAELYGPFASCLTAIDLKQITWESATGVSHWIWLGILAAVAIAAFMLIERLERPSTSEASKALPEPVAGLKLTKETMS